MLVLLLYCYHIIGIILLHRAGDIRGSCKLPIDHRVPLASKGMYPSIHPSIHRFLDPWQARNIPLVRVYASRDKTLPITHPTG